MDAVKADTAAALEPKWKLLALLAAGVAVDRALAIAGVRAEQLPNDDPAFRAQAEEAVAAPKMAAWALSPAQRCMVAAGQSLLAARGTSSAVESRAVALKTGSALPAVTPTPAPGSPQAIGAAFRQAVSRDGIAKALTTPEGRKWLALGDHKSNSGKLSEQRSVGLVGPAERRGCQSRFRENVRKYLARYREKLQPGTNSPIFRRCALGGGSSFAVTAVIPVVRTVARRNRHLVKRLRA
ncbi:hypothetical protein C2U70_23890 [Bradyrhizobium guangdongense]|nr:hypothetical protein C2U70_23890 [Bradyrhizobium guangdongense]